MILQIPEVRFSLEIVTPSVGDYVWVKYVNLSDAPAVEPVLFEEVVEYLLIAHLDVAGPWL